MRQMIRQYTSIKPKLRLAWENMTAKTVLYRLVRAIGAFLCGYVLANGNLFGGWVPFAACLTAALPMGLPFLASGIGAVLGYLQCWGIDTALAPICIVLLMLTAVAIFHNTTAQEYPYFMPLLASGMSLLVGMVFYFDAPYSALRLSLLLLRTLLAFPACLLYRRGLEERAPRALSLALFTLLLGLCGKTVGGLLNIGLAAGCAVSLLAALAEDGLMLAVLCGLAADLTGVAPLPVTAVLCGAALACRFFMARTALFRPFAAAVCAVGCLFAATLLPDLVLFSLLLGAVLGLTLPMRQTSRVSEGYTAQQLLSRIRRICNVFSGIYTDCEAGREEAELAPEQIYDRAAERVCRSCVLCHNCWESAAQETYAALHSISGRVMQHGGVQQEDFPPAFGTRCRHLEQFTAAVNEEMEVLLSRRQYQRGLREHRQLLREQMECTAELLRGAAQTVEKRLPIPTRYRLETGFSNRTKDAAPFSGDQCLCAALSQEITYIVLCDGMGTGQEAEKEGKRAAKLLMELLLAGASPQEALRLLNTAYLVQGSGVFSAVDVLRLNLNSAQAELYKWGGSATYLKRLQSVRAYGVQAPPPGLGLGESCKPARMEFSLEHGEILVLTTDGAAGEQTCERLRTYVGANLPQLAGYLVRSNLPASDDASVVTVRLYPRHG